MSYENDIAPLDNIALEFLLNRYERASLQTEILKCKILNDILKQLERIADKRV